MCHFIEGFGNLNR